MIPKHHHIRSVLLRMDRDLKENKMPGWLIAICLGMFGILAFALGALFAFNLIGK